jgi:hypothetical protein
LQRFSPMFPSRTFTVLGLPYRSMFHFKLNLLEKFMEYEGMDWSLFFLFTFECSIVPVLLIKKPIFVHWMVLSLLSLNGFINLAYKYGFISVLYSVPLTNISYCSDIVALFWVTASDGMRFPILFFLRIVLGLLGLLPFHINFEIDLWIFIFTKSAYIFIWAVL